MNKTAVAVLALLAFVALLLVQTNLAWATDDGGGEDRTARTWGQTSSGSFGFFSYAENRGWFDGGWDNEDRNAVGQFQVAAPLLLAATILLLVASMLAFGGDGRQAAIVALVGGILAAAATLLYFLGIQDLYSNNASWQAGFYLAFVGTLLGIAGGTVGLVTGNVRGSAN